MRKNKATTVPYSREDFLQDPEVLREYKRLKPQLDMIVKLIKIRTQLNLTQAQLAKKVGASQSLVSRIETGVASPSLDFLTKLADALNSNLEIKFKPRQ